MREVRPDVIYHYSPGYGSSGPKSMLQSFAPLVSGFVGQFVIAAGEGNRPQATFGNEDYYNGLLGACACLLGLIHRERTGVGQRVECPQLHSSVFTTSEYYKRTAATRRVIPRLDRGQYGWSAGYRIYQCLDAWICVTCTRAEQFAALVAAVVPEEARAGLSADDLACERADGRSGCGAARVPLRRTAGGGLGAGPGASTASRPRASGRRAGSTVMPSSNRRCSTTAASTRSSIRCTAASASSATSSTCAASPRPARGRAPLLGEHTREVLGELGYDDARVDELLAASAVLASADVGGRP